MIGTETDVRQIGKFLDPLVTRTGEKRAAVRLKALRTLWLNTGTLCNIACANCYIGSSPRNDSLVYLGRDEAARFVAEAQALSPGLEEIGFTGGEPFMNPDIAGMLADALATGLRVLVLTNAMKPLWNRRADLAALIAAHPGRLALRVSLDHFSRGPHETVRGADTWAPAIEGLRWLAGTGAGLAVAARLVGPDDESELRRGFAALFAAEAIPVDASDPHALVLFPEMDATADVPEITEACWGILGRSPDDVMCASSRMVVRRKGAERASVVACTLLPHEAAFDLGPTLAGAAGPVPLNHRHCARFCVLGGAACS
jgi:pyruvate-formate lyase-activating enzyme